MPQGRDETGSADPAFSKLGLIVALLPIFVMVVVGAEQRIYLLAPVALIFGMAVYRWPVSSLAALVLMMGSPIYIRVFGRDAGVVTTFLIVEMYGISLLRKSLRRETSLVGPAILILLVYGLAIPQLTSFDLVLGSTRLFIGLMSAFMLLHLILSYCVSHKSLNPVVGCLLIMILFQALVAVGQAYFPNAEVPGAQLLAARGSTVGPALASGVYRATGTIGDYELLAEWFAAALPIALSMMLGAGGFPPGIVLPYVLLIIAGLLATVTRGGIVAAGLGLAVFLALLTRQRQGRALGIVVATILGIGLPLAMTQLLFPGLVQGMMDRLNNAPVSLDLSRGLFPAFAMAINRSRWLSLPGFITEAHLLGYGFLPLRLLNYAGAGSLHSLWLTLWFQGGIIGVGSWAWLATSLGRAARSSLHSSRFPRASAVPIGFVASVVAMLASEMKVEFLRSEPTMQFFFLIVGLGVAFFRFSSMAAAQSAGPSTGWEHEQVSLAP